MLGGVLALHPFCIRYSSASLCRSLDTLVATTKSKTMKPSILAIAMDVQKTNRKIIKLGALTNMNSQRMVVDMNVAKHKFTTLPICI